MTHNMPPDDRDLAAEPFVGHETRDINIRAVLWLIAATALGTILVAAGLWILLGRYRADARRTDPLLSPLARPDALPPPPRLQDTPIGDYQEFVRQEEELLATYGWVDRRQGIVRIPVERAMELVAERGLPPPPSSAERPAEEPQP